MFRHTRHLIQIEKEGYEPYEIYTTKRYSGWLWGNLIFGLLPGLIVDAITGGMYKIDPDEIRVTLEPKKTS